MNQISTPSADIAMQPVLARLRNLGRCLPDLEAQVLALWPRTEAVAAKTVLWSDDAPVHRPRYLLEGWACRYRHLSDGRRQIFDIVLPGDGIGLYSHSHSSATTATLALTPLLLVDARALKPSDHELDGVPLTRVQAAADEERALRQIMRLGCMTALERLTDLFHELHERLEVVGQIDGPRFAYPLKQESLADLTGLSVVHVNRTLQELRRRGSITIKDGWVQLNDVSRGADLTERSPRQFAA